jgi:hypothetical protein
MRAQAAGDVAGMLSSDGRWGSSRRPSLQAVIGYQRDPAGGGVSSRSDVEAALMEHLRRVAARPPSLFRRGWRAVFGGRSWTSPRVTQSA